EDNLDENGLYSFSLDSEGSEKKLEIDGEKIPYKKPANFRIQATVTDKDDKSVSNTKSIKVYPGKFLIGINCIDTMKPAGDKFEFDIITTNNSGNLVGDKEVEIYIMKTTWSSVKELGVSGIYYNNTKKEEIVYNTSMTIKKGPTRFEYKAKESGSYDIIVKEKDGYSISSTYFYSYKKDQFLAWDFRSDDNLQLTADRNNYKPGEKAKILVKSPFPNSKAIVTLEREKIFWQKTIEMKGNSLPLEIPIEENYLPNVYLNVMVISPRMKLPDGLSEEEIAEFKKYDLGIPKIKTGRVELKVNIDSKIAKLEVESDKPTYSPGSTVRLKIKTEPGAEIGLSVADRAVLDLVAYKFDSPINSFYSNWEHGVKMFDIRDSLIKQLNIEPKGSSPGGDYGDESGSGGFAFDSEDGSRKNFKYTAFWSPDLKADSDGYKEVEFTLPDNLTTFKIMVITSKKGKYNTTNKEIIVKKPVVVQAVLPRFLRVNDKLNMGGLIINETGKDVEFKVSFTSKE
ncbi:MAG: peptidase, partial [Leptospiraceae bacterium]|nr:peptidase [Leptospiraceae bacterium]